MVFAAEVLGGYGKDDWLHIGGEPVAPFRNQDSRKVRIAVLEIDFFLLGGFTFLSLLHGSVQGQTNCEEGNGLLDSAAPRTLSVQEVIQKFGAAESATQEARCTTPTRRTCSCKLSSAKP